MLPLYQIELGNVLMLVEPAEITIDETYSPVKLSSDANDPSELIGAKLILGWALLDETCPTPECHNIIPLLRDRKGEVNHCKIDILYEHG